MTEIHGHVTAVRQEVLGDETTAAAIATDTVLYVADTVDFAEEGGHVRINGDVYAYVSMDEGDVTGTPSITLDAPGLTDSVAAETWIELWNPSANGGAGSTVVEWKVDVTTDDNSSSGVATLTHSLIPLVADGMPSLIGESVVVRADEDGSWTVVDVLGSRPGYDPQYIRTGVLEADVSITAGDPTGKRVVMNAADGTPAFEAYDASNNQTVNIDGVGNYMEGTLATAASGSRVEIGPGLLGGDPTDEARLVTDHADELTPGLIRTRTVNIDPGVDAGIVEVVGADWDGDADTPPLLELATGTSLSTSTASLRAHEVRLIATGGGVVTATGNLNATMGTGSVGTGTFRDSVDARVTTLAQPLNANLTTLAGVTPGAAGLALLDDATAADARATIGARALRRSVVSQTGTSYTLVLTDEDKVIQVSNAGTHTLTVPANASVAFPNGAEIEIVRIGAGAVNIAPDTGVTINSRGGLLGINGQYGYVRLRKRAADTWVLVGDLA